MRLDSFIIGILVFSVFMIGGGLVFDSVVGTYGLNTTSNITGFSSAYDSINETYDLSQDVKDETLDAETSGEDESWESLVKGAYSGVRLVRNSFGLAYDMIHLIARQVGIPLFLVDAAIIALTVAILFAIIYLVFRFKG